MEFDLYWMVNMENRGTQWSSTCANLCLHFSENGYAKYNGDLKVMENAAFIVDENIPGK
jgi:hypothetical protein